MESATYKVRIKFTNDLLGTVPHATDIFRDHVVKKSVAAGLAEEEVATVEALEDKGYTGFHKDAQGHFLYNYAIKGFLCEAARALRQWGTLKQLQDKFKRYVFVGPRRIRLPELNGEALHRPLRGQTAQGPRVALVKSDVVKDGTELGFTLTVLDISGITEKCLREVCEYGALMGMGQWRSGGYGTFEVV